MRIANYEDVFGEAFSKQPRKNAAFLKKGGTQKLFFYLSKCCFQTVANRSGPVSLTGDRA
ncbi:hypothetical protein F1542_12570 [Komagataeibacter sp. FXV3]|nr:hypothetical protein [Komagataeibacter sp. FXV3]